MSTGKLNVFGCCPKVSEMNINPAEIMLKELSIFGTLINPFTFPAATTLVNNMADKYVPCLFNFCIQIWSFCTCGKLSICFAWGSDWGSAGIVGELSDTAEV